MEKEYEIKVLDIDVEKIKKRLIDINAVLIGDFFYKRYVYKLDNNDCIKKWIRLRSDGHNTTLAIKKINNYSMIGTYELEFKVSSLEKTKEFLEELGYKCTGYQENKRIKYCLNNIDICIDTWPHIPTYLEIEGKNEADLFHILNLLQYTKEDIYTKNESIYSYYGYKDINLNNIEF